MGKDAGGEDFFVSDVVDAPPQFMAVTHIIGGVKVQTHVAAQVESAADTYWLLPNHITVARQMDPDAVAIGHDISILSRLADPRVRLAIWLRPNPCGHGEFPECALANSTEIGRLTAWLTEDAALLGGLYGSLQNSDWRVRVETATSCTYPAFHEDAVPLRF